jgi:hypothetical protein
MFLRLLLLLFRYIIYVLYDDVIGTDGNDVSMIMLKEIILRFY